MTEDEELAVVVGCTRLMNRYAVLTDAWDYEAFSALFTEDGVFQRPDAPPLKGPAAIAHFLKALYEERRAANPQGHAQLHLLTTIHIEPDGPGAADGVTYGLAFRDPNFTGKQPSPMTPPELVIRYRTRFRRTPEGWKIQNHVANHVFRK